MLHQTAPDRLNGKQVSRQDVAKIDIRSKVFDEPYLLPPLERFKDEVTR